MRLRFWPLGQSRWRSSFFQLLARLTKKNIRQDLPRSRFGKVWQNRARFNLALTCDFVILVNLALSCQTNILINHWVLHMYLNNLARTRKIFQDAFSGQTNDLHDLVSTCILLWIRKMTNSKRLILSNSAEGQFNKP